ncbi:hypothetical protein COMA2_250010 [Candidatus Nitrospira nitrificans]|uniref:Uncharacterized protein n=1 Tax=Candidatus Nitrospira nitrificans TaxID=1742973 RepID=A0A0S4LGD7_9BACT|nr:hypothetical protein COMA2_250010 [Candidatus Nitrospira nitrificans]
MFARPCCSRCEMYDHLDRTYPLCSGRTDATVLLLSRLALNAVHLQNPLALKRMNLPGEATQLSPDAPPHNENKQRYLERFPQAEMMCADTHSVYPDHRSRNNSLLHTFVDQ